MVVRKMSSSESDERKFSEGKICAVCGDVALGYNFNAVTCESCKAFFRRNALKNKDLKCPFRQSCSITALTRRFCQRCRLVKCYKVGMKRELIMSEADKEIKKRKIMANKARTTFKTSKNNKSVQARAITVDIAVQTDLPSMCTCICKPISQSSPDSLTCESPESSLGCTPLKPQDKELLDDLILASKALEAPVDQEIANLPGEFKSCNSNLLDVINLTALAIKRLIKMCKRISGFKVLCLEDQLTLLKQGCTQMMLLRSVLTFDPDKNTWKIPHTVDQMSQIKVEVLKEARGTVYEAHESFLRTFDVRASHDLSIMCILTAIALFDPGRTHLVDRQLITENQQTYQKLLQNYLLSVYSAAESNEIYQHLVFKMSELHTLFEEHLRVYLNVNPSQIEPLLIEIFDLKGR